MPKYPSRRRIIATLIGINASILLLFVTGWTHDSSHSNLQNNEKIIIRDLPDTDEPLEIAVSINGRTLSFGKEFAEERDWLKNLTLTIKNTSNKPITYARIDIVFPETKSTGPALIHQIFIGRRSDQTPELKSTLKHPPLYLLPNQSLDISLTSDYSDMKKLIEGRHSPIEDVKQMRIGLGEAMFVDETLYFGGRIFKRNPDANGPRKWIRVAEDTSIDSKIPQRGIGGDGLDQAERSKQQENCYSTTHLGAGAGGH